MLLRRAAVLLSLFTLATFAQELPPSSRAQIEVRLIEVDAVVTDRAGNPVTGLTADDFELYENGRRQAISNFAEYRETVAESGNAAPPIAPLQTPGVEQSVSRPAPRTVVLLLDALPLTGDDRTKLFDDLRALITRTMRDGDRAQLLTWTDASGVRAATPLTRDRSVIERALSGAQRNLRTGATGVTTEDVDEFFRQGDETSQLTTNAAEQAAATQRFSSEDELARMRRKTAAFQRVVTSLAQPDGRNVLVYVSSSFPLVAGRAALGNKVPTTLGDLGGGYSTRAMLDSMIATANANGVSLYAIRPALPRAATRLTAGDDDRVVRGGGSDTVSDTAAAQFAFQNDLEALNLVAKNTGGTVGIGPDGVRETVDRIVRDVGSYYSLAYRAQSDGSDRERRIEVRPRNAGLTVRTRRTIVDKSEKTRARDLVIARLFEVGPAGDLEFEVKSGKLAKAGDRRAYIPIDLSIPAEQLRFEPENGVPTAKFTVLAVAGADSQTVGTVYEDSRSVPAAADGGTSGNIAYHFSVLHDLKPTTLSIAVIDEKGGLSGTRQLRLGSGHGTEEITPTDPGADAQWIAALARAAAEHKGVLVFFRPTRCAACARFEKEVVTHPLVQRRLGEIVFLTQPIGAGTASKAWTSRDAGLALFDRTGRFRARWIGVPTDTTQFGSLLESVLSAAPFFDRAVTLSASGPYEGEVEAATGFSRLGRMADARTAVDDAIAHGSEETREFGLISRAIFDAKEGKTKEALSALDRVIAEGKAKDAVATAWLVTGTIHRALGATAEARRAFTTVQSLTSETSDLGKAAAGALQEMAASGASSVIALVPPAKSLVSGRQTIRTTVTSNEVARVEFSVDGKAIKIVEHPPFATTHDFGRTPQTRSVRAVAFDRNGRELGRDEQTVNDAGDTFWLRIVEPRDGQVSGTVVITPALRAPAGHRVTKVAISWNDVERAAVTGEPWQASIDVPKGQVGIIRAQAFLDDGRTAEDAVLINAGGFVEHADVQLVELPVTVTNHAGAPVPLQRDTVAVREGTKQRTIESVSNGDDAPLTVGLLFDTSGSMYKSLPDVQEAATRFLETALGPADRAFLVTFNSDARLVQAATHDRALLARQIAAIQPQGETALYDAMILGLLQFEGIKGRRALVLFSDGADTSSRYGGADVAELARRSNIPIHLIASAAPLQGTPALPQPARNTNARDPGRFDLNMLKRSASKWAMAMTELARVARISGGTSHRLSTLEKLPAAYAEIERALKAQALVVIRTDPGKHENDWRTIDVKVTAPGATVMAPEGYYAPW